MQNNEQQHSQAASRQLLAFESRDLESSLLNEVGRTPTPALRKRTVEPGRRRRPIRLKADLEAAKHSGVERDRKKTRSAKGHQSTQEGEAETSRRPITLKADLGIGEQDRPNTDTAAPARVSRKRKTAKSARRKPSTRSRKAASPAKPKITKAKQARQDKRQEEAVTDRTTTVEVRKAPQTPGSEDTSPPPSPAAETQHPSLSELWASWPQTWRRTVLAVALSFVAGILFHALFVSGGSPTPASRTETTQPRQQQPARAQPGHEAPSAPQSGYTPPRPSQPAPEQHRYPSGDEFYRGPDVYQPRGTPNLSPRQYYSPTETPTRRWDGYGYGHAPSPAAPYAAPPRTRRAPAAPRYEPRSRDWEQPRQRYNPWAYEAQ